MPGPLSFLAMRFNMEYIGVKEKCDKCKESYPMSWIVYTGKDFQCYACLYNNEAYRELMENETT